MRREFEGNGNEMNSVKKKKELDPNGVIGAKLTSPNHSLMPNSFALSVFPRKTVLISLKFSGHYQ